jgi:hypothetical protein
MKNMAALFLMFVAVTLGSGNVAVAKKATAVQKNGPVCLESCRTRLKANGTWSSFPRGYCRRECGM